jgi:hypothetical protein
MCLYKLCVCVCTRVLYIDLYICIYRLVSLHFYLSKFCGARKDDSSTSREESSLYNSFSRFLKGVGSRAKARSRQCQPTNTSLYYCRIRRSFLEKCRRSFLEKWCTKQIAKSKPYVCVEYNSFSLLNGKKIV